ncbi:probable basic-leucine zipper transcription factor E [Cephus cinctus]|uniref:Probable basic-leucine zipper transcription factor E n=1 Tax=Cephus cinctus TaxID=211228 RepID=A0AAJ7FUV8_CEPCN|nr:probable basic-leucine zipper transcription factor E [Cephus cinctus]
MQEYCPLCIKDGLKKKIRLLQLNLQEASWVCESEDCIWPWGYYDIQFVSRKVGKVWSFNWDNGTTTIPKTQEPVKIYTELSLYTPPVTPSSEAILKERITSEIPCSTSIPISENQDILDSDIHVIKTTNFTKDLSINKISENSMKKFMPDTTDTCLSNKVDISSSKCTSIFDVDDIEKQDNCKISSISSTTTKKWTSLIKTSETVESSVIQDQMKENNLCSRENNVNAKDEINITQYPMRESETSSVSNYEDESHMNASCSLSHSIPNIKMSDTTNSVCSNILQSDTTKISEKNVSLENNTNIKSVPTVRSVEKINVDITKVVRRKMKNENITSIGSTAASIEKNSELQNNSNASPTSKVLLQTTKQTTKLLMNSSSQSAEHNISSISKDKCTMNLSNESSDNSEVLVSNKVKPPLQVTTMEFDGLPPITLTYEMPELLEAKGSIKNVDEKTQLPVESIAGSSISENNPDELLSINEILKKSNRKSKRSNLNGIKYEKFNFNEIRKKLKQNNNGDNAGTNVANDLSSKNEIFQSSDVNVSKTIDIISNADDKCFTIVPINECQVVSQCSTPVESNIHVTVSNIPSTAAITPDRNSVLTPNINIDSLLDSYSYLVNNSQDISQTLNDDWLESLLN